MCPSMKLLLTFSTLVAAQQCEPEQGSEGRCLLAKKAVMGKVSLIQEQSMMAFEELSLKQRDWRIRHQSVEGAMNASKTLLDRFIDAQATSSTHCSSRLMESKRILDGIIADVRTLNRQVTSQEEILEVETENLKITKMSIDATYTQYKQSITVCKEERKEALAELKKYTNELAELNSIANPSMRMEIAHSVKIQKHEVEEEPVKPTGIEKDIALTEIKFSKEMCEAFVAFSQHHGRHQLVADPEKGSRDCDKQREELQKAFEEAYKEISELKEMSREDSLDETCFTTAEEVKAAELVPLVSQREVAVEKIEVATNNLAALDPVLELVKGKAEKLRKHIKETLTPECEEAGEASELLVKVRKLIISLEECPGRNDFKLKIPSMEEEGPEEEPVAAETTAEVPEEAVATETTTAEVPEEEETSKPPVEEEKPDLGEEADGGVKEEVPEEEPPVEEKPTEDEVPEEEPEKPPVPVPEEEEAPNEDKVPAEKPPSA